MTVKELAELLTQKKYDEFCDACAKISPRALTYLSEYIDDFQDELYKNVSAEQFQKWRYALSYEAEQEYVKKNNVDLYTLTKDEQKQACLVE